MGVPPSAVDGPMPAPAVEEQVPAAVDGSHPWRTVAAVAIVGLFVALPLRALFRGSGSPMEEGFMLVFPERVLAGDIPNRDFLHLYGPGSLWVLAGVYKVFGTSITVERVVGLIQHL